MKVKFENFNHLVNLLSILRFNLKSFGHIDYKIIMFEVKNEISKFGNLYFEVEIL